MKTFLKRRQSWTIIGWVFISFTNLTHNFLNTAIRMAPIASKLSRRLTVRRSAEGGMFGVRSNGAWMAADPIDKWEDLWINSWVSRWLSKSAYGRRSVLVTRLVTKSLNSPRRPWNTYRLKSVSEIGRPAAASSSNKVLTFYRNWVTESSPCRRSWREPWSCIIRELDVKARACSSVCQTEHEVGQSTTRWRTSMDSEESKALRMSWFCCFQQRKSWDTWRETPSAARICGEGQEFEPSTKSKTLWPKRYGFICIRQYK